MDSSYKPRKAGFKLEEGVEISIHALSKHKYQKCKISGRQRKDHHDN